MDHEPLFRDALFRQKRKKGKYRQVEPPQPALEAPVADTHAHVHLLPDPALALARAGVHGVTFVQLITDPAEDGTRPFACLDAWLQQAAEQMPRLLDPAASDASGAPGAPDAPSAPDAATAPKSSGVPAAAAPGAPDLFATSDASDSAASPLARASVVEPVVPRTRIAVGVHPHNAKLYDEVMEAQLKDLLHDQRVSALGEVGLDYHYDLSPREVQRDVFRRQIRLAKEAGLPLVLHMREAHDDGFRILEEEGFPTAGTLLHCYNLDARELRRWTQAGCYVAFGGPLTFKNADDVREAAAQVPLDRLLTETDAPYMTPEPMRGMTCGPAHTVFTAQRLAEVRQAEPGAAREALLRQLMENARGLLDRPATAWQTTAQAAACQATASQTAERIDAAARAGAAEHAGAIACADAAALTCGGEGVHAL